MMRKILVLILLSATTCTITGCWNYREVNDIWMVSGLAIDWDSRNKEYLLTAEIVLPKGGKETAISSQIISFSSDTIFDGMRKSISISGKKLYWAHTKIIIISKEVAKQGIIPMLDIVNRSDEFRTNIIFAVSKEKTAKEILQKKLQISDSSSFQLDEIFKSQKNISTFFESEMWEFYNDLLDEGISPVLSTIKLAPNNQTEIVPQVDGVAVFKKDKLIGYLNGSETKSLLFVRNMLKGGDIPLKNIADTKTSITLEILKSQTKLKPKLNGNDIDMEIKVKIDVAITEIGGSYNFINEEGLKKIKAATNKKIEGQILEAIEKCQNELECDVLGFGKSIQKNMPNEWKKLEPNWDEEFKNVNVYVKVDTRIISSYRSYKSINAGD